MGPCRSFICFTACGVQYTLTLIVGEKLTGVTPILLRVWRTFLDMSPQKLDRFGQNLAEGCGIGKEWSYKIFREITPEATEKGAKYQPFSWWMLCSHLITSASPVSTKLGRNMWISVLVNRFVAKFWNFSTKGRFSPKTDFSGSFCELWGSII